MPQSVAAVIVGSTGSFREALLSNLRPPAFRVVAPKGTLSDLGWEEFPRTEPYLVVIQCGESPRALTAQIAQFKQQNPQARVALLGQHWGPADIGTALEAGASAYFAEAAISKEFLQAIKLITR